MRPLLALLITLASLVASAEPTPTQHAAAVAAAESRGAELYALDRAAWVATDDLEERFSKRKRKGVTGWIVLPGAETMTVVWIGGEGAEARAYFETAVPRATLTAEATLQPELPRALTGLEARMWQARATALKQTFEACRKGYNTVVVPVGAEGGEDFDVYLLYLMQVTAATGAVMKRRDFSRSCIAATMPKNAVSWMGTHLLDPTPNEIHVFVSLQTGKGLMIVTTENGLLWDVSDGQIAFEGGLDDKD
jgi:hypothetical protein